MPRRRASGPGSNSRRFAGIRRPDGSIDKVPAAKDAATYLFEATEAGEWPQRYFVKFLYEATTLTAGAVFDLKEMRPGEGMGRMRRMRVVAAETEVDVYPNGYGQLKRLVLVTGVAETEAEAVP
jgi:hypothetical protein